MLPTVHATGFTLVCYADIMFMTDDLELALLTS